MVASTANDTGTSGRPAAAPTGRLYFVSGPVDFALLGGASIALFVVLWVAAYNERTEAVRNIALTLAWFVNWPHFAATLTRLYGSRAATAQVPITAWVVPALIGLGVVIAFALPAFAPVFVKLFIVWSPYHFSGQTLGLSLLYARRGGLTVTPVERFALSAFIFSTFIAASAAGEVGTTPYPYFGIDLPRLGVTVAVADACRVWVWLSGAMLVAVLVRWSLREKRLVPPIVLVPALAQLVWFVPDRSGHASFSEFVPLFHSLQYLLVAWSVRMKETIDATGRGPSVRVVLAESYRFGLVTFFLGALLFWGLPAIAAGLGWPRGIAEPILIAAVQMHHFFVDGVIWKLKNPRVTAPLSATLDDLIGARGARRA